MAKGIVRNIFSDTLVYGFTKYFAILASVFLTPIYTRLLSKSDFGIMDVFNTWNAMIIAILPLGLFNAMLRFFPEVKNDAVQRKKLFGAIFGVILIACGIYATSILFLKNQYLDFFIGNRREASVFYYSILIVVLAVIHAYFLQILQIRFQKFKYVTVSLINFFILTSLGFYLVYGLNQGISGFFRASALALSVSNLIGAIFVYHDLHIRFEFNQIRRLLSYSIHFIAVFFMLQLSQVIDRYLINSYLDLSNVGIYSIAIRIGNLLQIAISSFGTAWMPYAMSLKDHPESKKIYSKMFDVFILALVSLISAVLIFRKEIILFFAPGYTGAYDTIFWVLLANMTMGMIYVFSLGIQITKRTKFLSYAVVFSVVANFIVSILLINQFGIEGVAIGSVVGAAVWIGFQHYFSQKYYAVNYRYFKNFLTISALLLPLFLSKYLDTFIQDFWQLAALKSIIVLLIFGFVFLYLVKSKSLLEVRGIQWKK